MSRQAITTSRQTLTADRTSLSDEALAVRESGAVRFEGDIAIPVTATDSGNVLTGKTKIVLEIIVSGAPLFANNNVISPITNPAFSDGVMRSYFQSDGKFSVLIFDAATGNQHIMRTPAYRPGYNLYHAVFDRTKAVADSVSLYRNGSLDQEVAFTSGSSAWQAFGNQAYVFGPSVHTVSRRSAVNIGRTRIFEFSGDFDTSLPARMFKNPADYGSMTLLYDWAFTEPSGTTVVNQAGDSDYDLTLGQYATRIDPIYKKRQEV